MKRKRKELPIKYTHYEYAKYSPTSSPHTVYGLLSPGKYVAHYSEMYRDPRSVPL